MKVNVHEAKSQLSRLLAAADAGEEVVIARHGKPVARLMPVEAPKKRRRTAGNMKGMFKVDDSFFDPLPDDALDLWEGR